MEFDWICVERRGRKLGHPKVNGVSLLGVINISKTRVCVCLYTCMHVHVEVRDQL